MATRTTSMMLVTLATLLVAAGTGLAANQEQSGQATTCVDNNVLWQVDGVDLGTTTGNSVQVGDRTAFEVSSSTNDPVYVDFFDDEGEWVGWNEGKSTGTVPSGATFGTVCVAILDTGFDRVPNPAATWTYQDGL